MAVNQNPIEHARYAGKPGKDAEVRVIESFHYTLCEATKVAPDVFASLLVQNQLCKQTKAEAVRQCLSSSDFSKSVDLVNAVVSGIRTSTHEDAERRFNSFVNDVLRHCALQLGHIAEPMEDKYGKMKYQRTDSETSDSVVEGGYRRTISGGNTRSDSVQSEFAAEHSQCEALLQASTIDDRIKELNEQFQHIYSDMRSEFIKNDITPDEALDVLSMLPAEHKREYEEYLTKNMPQFEKADSIKKCLRTLYYHIQFTDYALIENLIEKLGSKDLKCKMSKYKNDFLAFSRVITVKHIIESKYFAGEQRSDLSEGFMELKAVINHDSSSYNLEQLHNLRGKICSQLRLMDVILYLKGAKEFRSFLVSWLFPTVLCQEIMEAVNHLNTCFVLREQIIMIIVGDKAFYPQHDDFGKMVCQGVSHEVIGFFEAQSSVSHTSTNPAKVDVASMSEDEFWDFLTSKGIGEIDLEILKENGVNQQYIAVSLEEGHVEEDEFDELELSMKGKEILISLLKRQDKQKEVIYSGWLLTCFNYVKIQQRYTDLMLHLFAHLERRVNVLDIHDFLCSTFSPHNCSSDHIPQAYNGIFSADIWIYDNPFPVKCITNKFLPETDMKEHIERYDSNLAEFRKSTKIADFNAKCRIFASKALYQPNEIVCVYYSQSAWQIMEMKVDIGDETSTLHLSLIDDLSSRLSQHFILSDGNNLTVKDIIKQELILDWRVPAYVTDKLYQLTVDAINFLCSRRIILMLHKDRIIFDRTWVDQQLALLEHCKKGKFNEALKILEFGMKLNVNICDKELKSPLWHASRNGLTDVVKLLINHGSNIESKDTDGRSSLFIACVYNRTDIMKILINEGADVNAQEELTNELPLHAVSDLGHYEAVQILLKNRSQIDAKAVDDLTPMHLACREGHTKIVNLLITYGANIESCNVELKTPLWVASFYGKPEVAEVLLNQKAQVDCKSKHGWTPLHAASLGGHKAVVQLLLKNNAMVNEENMNCSTSLHIASQEDHADVAEILIGGGGYIDKKNKVMAPKRLYDLQLKPCDYKQKKTTEFEFGNTPLHIASYKGRLDASKVLIAHGAKVDIQNDSEGKTPLWKASYYGHTKVVLLLLEHKAQPNLAENHQWTSLHAATQQGHLDVVKVLLNYQAEVDILNDIGWSPLQIASQHGHIAVAKVLINHGAKINLKTKIGWTALHIATQEGHYEFVQLLIHHNAEVNLKTKNGWTPLHVAAQGNKNQIAELLIDNGAKVETQTKDRQAALHIACKKGNFEVVKVLIAKGARRFIYDDVDMTPLEIAVYMANVAVVKLLLDDGIDINNTNNDGWSLFHIASELGHIEVIELLAGYKMADINIKDKSGKTPLWIASFHGKVGAVTTLLNCGADSNIWNDNGWNPFHISCQRGHTDVNEVFLNYGVSVDIQTKDGKTPLIIGSLHRQKIVVQQLIDCKAQVNSHDKNGWTALHAACQNDDLDIIRLLMKKGAEVDTKNQEGRTPLLIATFLDKVDTVEELLEFKANVNLEDKHKWTPLHVACQEGQERIAKLLLNHKADVNTKEEYGRTPLWIATVNSKAAIVKLLLQYKAHVNEQRFDGSVPLHVVSDIHIASLLIMHGASVNLTNKDLDTPLHTAIETGQTQIAELLIKHSALIDVENKNGISPLHLACQEGYSGTVEILLKRGAKVDAQTKAGMTGLILATQKGCVEVVRSLLSSKANPNLSERESLRTPLMHAASEGNLQLVKLFLSHKASVHLKDKNDMTALDIAELNQHSDICQELKLYFKVKPKVELSKDKMMRLTRKFMDALEQSLLPGRTTKKKRMSEQKQVYNLLDGTMYELAKSSLPAISTHNEICNKSYVKDTIAVC